MIDYDSIFSKHQSVFLYGKTKTGKRNPQQGWIRVRARATAPSLSPSGKVYLLTEKKILHWIHVITLPGSPVG